MFLFFFALFIDLVTDQVQPLSRLNDGAATRDEESKAMFMHELSELVKDVLEAKSNQEDVSR